MECIPTARYPLFQRYVYETKLGEPSGSPSVSWLLLSGFARGDPVGRRSADAEGSSIVGFGCANSYESGGLRVYRHLVETELPQIPPDPFGRKGYRSRGRFSRCGIQI